MKFVEKDSAVWVKMESLDDVRLMLRVQATKQEAKPKAIKTLVARPRRYKTPCEICGKRVKGMKLHIRKSHQVTASTVPAWMKN